MKERTYRWLIDNSSMNTKKKNKPRKKFEEFNLTSKIEILPQILRVSEAVAVGNLVLEQLLEKANTQK